ncbi:unnamed protein product [Vicia faba]|uniref:Uncharacterized protein n=1 Tax=Vicia faba TaxID=3906 RepID=A0AAV0Z9Y8_VICFA|nr:unnamed protein product [Vicia faba]
MERLREKNNGKQSLSEDENNGQCSESSDETLNCIDFEDNEKERMHDFNEDFVEGVDEGLHEADNGRDNVDDDVPNEPPIINFSTIEMEKEHVIEKTT